MVRIASCSQACGNSYGDPSFRTVILIDCNAGFAESAIHSLFQSILNNGHVYGNPHYILDNYIQGHNTS